MKERFSASGIPIHTPTEFERERGAAYLVCLKAALAAKAMSSAGENEMGEHLYDTSRRKVQRLGFSGDIFDYVVDYKIRLEKERRDHGKR